MPNLCRSTASFLFAAAILGAVMGMASTSAIPQGRTTATTATGRIGVAAGLVRARSPIPGDRWGGCDDARAAGTAPIYEGEPGYRSDMDGDGDGIACEPRP